MPGEEGGWSFVPLRVNDAAAPSADFRDCHNYRGAAFRLCSTRAEREGGVNDVGSDAYWDKILKDYYAKMWWNCPGLMMFIYICVALILRMIEAARWIVLPDPSDFGKSSFVDFLGDKLGLGEGVKTFRNIWLEKEDVLRCEGLPYIDEIMMKTPELKGVVSSDLWKNLPKEEYKQHLRQCHAADSVQTTLAFTLRFVEMNPAHDGMCFSETSDDFNSLVKTTAVISKSQSNGGRFSRNTKHINPTAGVFPVDRNAKKKPCEDGARRAFWRDFVDRMNKPKYKTNAVKESFVDDLRTFDAAHGTSIQQHTETWVNKLGVYPPVEENNAENGGAAPAGADLHQGGRRPPAYHGPWDVIEGIQPATLRSERSKRRVQTRLERGELIARKTWHGQRKNFTGSSIYFPNYFPSGPAGVAPPFGKRGKLLNYRETPNISGLRFHLKYGNDREPELLQDYLAGAQTTGPLGLVVNYQFYRALLNRDEGSRRTALKAAAATITRESRGAGHRHKKRIADIRNCDFVMFLISVELLGLPHNPPLRHLRQIVEHREEVFDRLGDVLTYEERKQLALESAYALYAQHDELVGLVEDLKLVAELFAQAYPDYYASLETRAADLTRDDEDRKDPKRTLLAYVAHDRCNAVLSILESVCFENGVTIEATINDAAMYSIEDNTLVERVVMPIVAERLRRDLGVSQPVQFAIQDPITPPHWETSLGRVLADVVKVPDGQAIHIGDGSWAEAATCGWKMLYLLGFDLTRLLAKPTDPTAGANILTLTRSADAHPVIADTLTPGHKYAFLQHLVQPDNVPHWVGIDWTREAPRVLDPKDKHERVCVDPVQVEAIKDFSQSGAGVLFRLDEIGRMK